MVNWQVDLDLGDVDVGHHVGTWKAELLIISRDQAWMVKSSGVISQFLIILMRLCQKLRQVLLAGLFHDPRIVVNDRPMHFVIEIVGNHGVKKDGETGQDDDQTND